MGVLPPWPVLSAFLVASLVLAISPGPGVFYIVARSVAQGPASGLASAAGVALGNWVNSIAAAVGLTALFAASNAAFMLVRYAGAAYLIYLGVQLLRSPRSTPAALPATVPVGKVLRDGFLVALLNPKTTLFFAAFLPQFTDPDRSFIQQAILLGSIFVAVAAITDSVYAVAAGAIAPWLRRSSTSARLGRRMEGVMLIGLGMLTALGGVRRAR